MEETGGELRQDHVQETCDTQEKPEETGKPAAAFESIYERLPDISLKSVDRFIIICVIALILVVLVGILRARHII